MRLSVRCYLSHGLRFGLAKVEKWATFFRMGLLKDCAQYWLLVNTQGAQSSRPVGMRMFYTSAWFVTLCCPSHLRLSLARAH
jgi:hypothetical protein